MKDQTTFAPACVEHLELHGARTGNCLRAAIALKEAGLDFAVEPISLNGGEHRSAAHLARNPRGKVPVLVVREAEAETVLTQSNAIMFFAAEQGRDRLLPPDGPARVRVLDVFFHFATDIICVNNAAFRLERTGETAGASYLKREYLAAVAASERLLTTAGFMGGDAFSLADISAYTVIQSVADQLPWHALPMLEEWLARIAGRPAVQSGMRAFG